MSPERRGAEGGCMELLSSVSPIVMTCYLSFWQNCGRLIASVNLFRMGSLYDLPIHFIEKGVFIDETKKSAFREARP